MPRAFTPKVVTANDLLLGDVIYLTADDSWTRALAEAEVQETEDHAVQRLQLAQTHHQIAVGPYLADVRLGADGPEPTHFREAFRTRGPSNYHHGKQEARNV